MSEVKEKDSSSLALIMMLVIIAISGLIVILLHSYLERNAGIETTKFISMEDTFFYSTGGMTFAIPSKL